jgi:hypothetical protein
MGIFNSKQKKDWNIRYNRKVFFKTIKNNYIMFSKLDKFKELNKFNPNILITNHYECLAIDSQIYVLVKEIIYDYELIAKTFLVLNKEYTREFWHPSRINKWNWILNE